VVIAAHVLRNYDSISDETEKRGKGEKNARNITSISVLAERIS
jgi:hypothetical protein